MIKKEKFPNKKIKKLLYVCLRLSTAIFEIESYQSIYTQYIEEIKNLENDILFTLDGNILIPTIYSFWSRKNGNVPLKDIREKLLGLYLRDDIYMIFFDEINL